MNRSSEYQYHPACLLFPALLEDELQALADDIKARGLLNPVVLHEGRVLDGRNRLAACQIAGVEPRFQQWNGDGSPVEWVISTNLMRRHLTASQRAAIALEMLPLLEAEAKERQRRSPGRGKKVTHDYATFSGNGKAAEVAARIAKAGSRYVETLKSVHKAAPELVERVRLGDPTVPDAKRVSVLSTAERAKVLKRLDGRPISDVLSEVRVETRHRQAKAFAKTNTDDNNIITGDMGLLSDRLKDDSVDLFLTDPPYDDVDAYGRLAELAAAKLKPGGFCLAYTGHIRLPEVLKAMAEHLSYWWTFAIEFAGKPRAVHARRILVKWRPVVAFVKPPLRMPPDWLTDLVKGGGRQKDRHEWGQAESEAAYLIQRLTDAGQLVVDPFCGSGTVPAACKATGRRWLATEANEMAAATARKRLAGQ
jgi:hypothetical protein